MSKAFIARSLLILASGFLASCGSDNQNNQQSKEPLRLNVQLAPAYIDDPYNSTLTADGGVRPYRYIIDGTLPKGLSYTDGRISGTPQEKGTFDLTFTVEDSNLSSRVQKATLTIGDTPPPQLEVKYPLAEVDAPFVYAFNIRARESKGFQVQIPLKDLKPTLDSLKANENLLYVIRYDETKGLVDIDAAFVQPRKDLEAFRLNFAPLEGKKVRPQDSFTQSKVVLLDRKGQLVAGSPSFERTPSQGQYKYADLQAIANNWGKKVGSSEPTSPAPNSTPQTPAQPTGEKPAQSTQGQPTQPAQEQPQQPAQEQPTQPAQGQTSQEQSTQPTEDTKQPDPADTTAKPQEDKSDTTPAEDPAKQDQPAQGQPQQPVQEQPTQPAQEQPNQPTQEQPTQQTPTEQPATEQTAQPTQEPSKESVADQPTTDPAKDAAPTEPTPPTNTTDNSKTAPADSAPAAEPSKTDTSTTNPQSNPTQPTKAAPTNTQTPASQTPTPTKTVSGLEGDLNGDGSVDQKDVDTLRASYAWANVTGTVPASQTPANNPAPKSPSNSGTNQTTPTSTPPKDETAEPTDP